MSCKNSPGFAYIINALVDHDTLPGEIAQGEIVGKHRLYPDPEIGEIHKNAAVLFLLFPSDVDGSTRFVLIKRSTDINDPHSGQISLPGGAYENKDKDLSQTALRECEEEIGVPKAQIKILRQLSPFYIKVSNFLLTPFLAYTDSITELKVDPVEVAEVFTVRIQDILPKNAIKSKDIQVRNNTLKGMKYFSINNEIVWGATAMVINEVRLHIWDAMRNKWKAK